MSRPFGQPGLRERNPAEIASRTSLILGSFLLLFGIGTALATAWIVRRTFSPILFFDQWNFVNSLMLSNGHLSLAQLWALHNEHRIPWEKLAMYADLTAFGGRNISLLLESYLLQGAGALFLIWIFRRYNRNNLPAWLTASGLFLFAAFYPIQIENFYWGFQAAFVTLPLAAAVSIAAAIQHSEAAASRDSSPWISWPLTISLGAAFVAETSLASGILLWPLLFLLSFVLRMSAKSKYVIAAVGTFATGLFLWGFHSPGNTSNPVESFRHPIAVGKFVRATLGWTWDSAPPTGDLWPTLAQLCAMIAGLVVVAAFLRVAFSAQPDKLQLFFLANAVYLLTTLFVIALGRINLGITQAIASRYQTIALTFWASFAALLVLWGTGKPRSPERLVEMQIALVLLLLAAVPRFAASYDIAKGHQRLVDDGYMRLLQNPSDSDALASISPFPNFSDIHAFLQREHWGVQDREFQLAQGILRPVSALSGAPLAVNGMQVLPADQCSGHLDWVERVPGNAQAVVASGWAWAGPPGARPPKILLVLDDGTIVGSGRESIPRPDVMQHAAGVTELNTGWIVQGRLPPGRTMRAFVVFEHSRQACPMPDEFHRP
jgi:hypothetical protein